MKGARILRRKMIPKPTVAEHYRYNELEKKLDAMYDRPDIYSREWENEKFELEHELTALKQFLESET